MFHTYKGIVSHCTFVIFMVSILLIGQAQLRDLCYNGLSRSCSSSVYIFLTVRSSLQYPLFKQSLIKDYTICGLTCTD